MATSSSWIKDKTLKKSSPPKVAIIIGAGPAGLTAAYELLERTAIKPIIFETSHAIGGISQTINYKGNRMDIGGHRFFSKSERVMQWWQHILPIQGAGEGGESVNLTYHKQQHVVSLSPNGPDPETTNEVMLIRHRLSRIYFLKKFFDYPISLNSTTMKNLGFRRMIKIGLSYLKAKLRPIRPEQSLEDFIVNRFGRELYLLFFKSYTEKVWGVPCQEIPPDWGAQRIKGISITTVILHALKKPFQSTTSIDQKHTETSLIEQFMYPKFGPGQIWETVAKKIKRKGAELHLDCTVIQINHRDKRVVSVVVQNKQGRQQTIMADYVFSTMPVKDLIASLVPSAPKKVTRIATDLPYRDFITVGILVKKLALPDGVGITNIVPDNWIYIQDRDVMLGRLQIFNNWSPYLVKDPEHTVWMGLEYFCYEGDELWSKTDQEMMDFAQSELEHIGVINRADVLDGTVVHVKKTYPAYFGSFAEFDKVRAYVDTMPNLYLLGRNGMHRYNNADHSMLTAMVAVDNIVQGVMSKKNLWSINTEEEYHEQK